MIQLLVIHAAVGSVILVGAGRLRRAAFGLAAVPMALTLAYAAWRAGGVLDGRPVAAEAVWVERLGLSVGLRLDGFGLLMMLVVSGVGLAVLGYGASYFGSTGRAARTAGLLVLFAGSMLGVVLADNLGFLYVAWELTSVASFLLIGGDHERAEARSAALHALLVTGAGGLAMLGGLVVLASEAGTWSLSELVAAPPTGPAAGVGLALVGAGIVTKSAQYPAHAWLPAAMVAPTPVSAYLHSATMVKAGVYLAARLAPAFVASAGGWRPAIVSIGVVTMVAGGLRALRQHDLKLLLAMGTISQLGFLLVLLGTGTAEATLAGCALLVAHALFKATLFLVVGIIDHQAGTRDRRQLTGFGAGWGAVKLAAAVAAASMIGLPPMLGFVAKEAAFDGFSGGAWWESLVLAGLVSGSGLTVAYTTRFVATVLARPAPAAPSPVAPPLPLVAPAFVLAVLTVVGGLGAAALVDPLVGQATSDLDPGASHPHLALWHGFGQPLVLSGLALALGGLVVAARRPIGRLLDAAAPRYGGAEAYRDAVAGLNVAARRTAGIAQSGSLPIYIAVIDHTPLPPTTARLLQAEWPGWPALAESPVQLVVASVISAAALGAALATHRFAAALLLGVVGYGMGVAFMVQGAPDLALTQFAIETLTVVAFVLVLRFLPPEFHRRRPALGVPFRVGVSVAVAVVVFAFAVVSAAARQAPPVSDEIIERALPDAGGSNVVNVVLVDFRGLDTLGEISVLAVAGLGAVALGRIGRRPIDGGQGRR